ncbi:MAG: SBBP repeat-containing protein, partial [Candidatus Acidiferrum sp.]
MRNYARVQYRGIYPGVDLLYYGNQHQLEYDFILAPGADPDQIRLSVAGARRVELDAQGNLLLATDQGEVVLRKPLVYQQLGDTRREVAGNFRVEGQEVSFAIGDYDRNRQLVIDPTLNYATYLGRSVNDKVNAIALGSDGSTYVAGIAPAITSGGQDEAFVAHISTDGKQLLYMAYLGASGATDARGIAVDPSGNAYITGETKATDFPALNSLQSSCSLNASRQCVGDAYLAKLNSDGSLNYATFLGGSGEDAGNALALDAAGNIYITGSTGSTDFPVFHPAQATTGGNGDAFIAKISSDGQHVLYATYLGGSGNDEALGIAIDANSNVYVTGQTLSPDFPTENAFQARCLPGTSNQCLGEAFVTKLSSDGSSLVYSTYLGGSGGDSANAIAVDNLGQVYVAGQTLSIDFPLASSLQAAAGGKSEAFVTKFLPNGAGLVYSTFLGGSGDDVATSIAVDSHGNAFVSGYTDSVNFPTQSPLQSACQKDSTGACSQDAFLAVMNSSGSALKFSTYLGGTGADEGKGIVLDTKGSAYLGGASTSADFPTAQPIVVPSGVSPKVLQSSSQVSSATTGASTVSLPSNLSGGGVVAMVSGLPNADASEACTGTISWVGTAGDNQWTTATNWSTGVLPVSTDSVCIGTSFASATINVGTISSTTNQTITNLVSNANIAFTSGPLMVTSGAAFVNALSITNGTLTLNGTSGSSVGGTMTQSAGTLTGTDTLAVAGLLTWSGGTESGTGTTTANGTTMVNRVATAVVFPPSSNVSLTGRTFTNNGLAVWQTGTAGQFVFGSGAQWNNAVGSTWNFQNDTSIVNGGGTGIAFNNSGTFEKTGTSTTAATSAVNNPIAFNNTGTVAASAGTLSFGGGGTCGSTCAGSWTVNSGATLQYSSLTFALSGTIGGSAATQGGGTVSFSGATVNYTGSSYNIAGGTVASGGTANFTAPGVVTNAGPLTISGGTLNFSTGNAIATTTMNQSAGTLAGTDALTISGLLTWSGGTESGTGTTTANGTTMVNGVATAVVFPPSSNVSLTGRTFTNNGLAVWQTGTAGQFVFGSGAQWTNAASSTWNFQNDTSLVNGGGTGQAFNNSGIFEKTGSNSTSTA